MEEGVFVEWLKKDGDIVKPGDVLYVVESDKSLNEVEAFDAGILRIIPNVAVPGAKLSVGTKLAQIVSAQDDDIAAGQAGQAGAQREGLHQHDQGHQHPHMQQP